MKTKPIILAGTIVERFWSKVEKTDGCWIWTGPPNAYGYGVITGKARSNQTYTAHRVSWTINVGPIPDGMTIDHLCLNKICVNPAHLEVVTNSENIRRAGRLKMCARPGHKIGPHTGGRRKCHTCQAERQRNRRLKARAS